MINENSIKVLSALNRFRPKLLCRYEDENIDKTVSSGIFVFLTSV